VGGGGGEVGFEVEWTTEEMERAVGRSTVRLVFGTRMRPIISAPDSTATLAASTVRQCPEAKRRGSVV